MAVSDQQLSDAAETLPEAGQESDTATTDDNSPEKWQNRFEAEQRLRKQMGEKNTRLNTELSQLKQQLAELKSAVDEGKTKKLEDSGDTATLYKQVLGKLKEKDAELEKLREQLQKAETGIQTTRMEYEAKSTLRDFGISDQRRVDQAYALLNNFQHLKTNDEGELVVLNGGVEVPLADFIKSQKTPGSDYEHFFAPSAKRGMGSSGSVGTQSVTVEGGNPWIRGAAWNLTRQIAIEDSNPKLAEALRAEAARLQNK